MNSPIRRLQARTQHGVTLIESLVVLTIGAIVLGATAPSFEQARERRQVESVAAQLETDIQHARSLAVSRSIGVRMSFSAEGGASCYVVHTGSAEDCQCQADGNAACSAGAQPLQVTRLGVGEPVQLTSNSRSMLFDPVKGTVTPTATIRVQSTNGHTVHQVVNIMGRVRSCSPNGQMGGYRTC